MGSSCNQKKNKGLRQNVPIFFIKGIAKDKQRTCAANAAGENSTFIFTVCDKSVPLYHFMFAYVVLHMAVKEFFETHH